MIYYHIFLPSFRLSMVATNLPSIGSQQCILSPSFRPIAVAVDSMLAFTILSVYSPSATIQYI